MNLELDINTPKSELPTTGYSIVIGAPLGFPIRDNEHSVILCLCDSIKKAEQLIHLLQKEEK